MQITNLSIDPIKLHYINNSLDFYGYFDEECFFPDTLNYDVKFDNGFKMAFEVFNSLEIPILVTLLDNNGVLVENVDVSNLYKFDGTYTITHNNIEYQVVVS